MTTNAYDIGDLVSITGAFTNSAGAAVDPTTVALTVRDPSGTESTYTYALGTVSRSALGNYFKQITPDASGTWYYRWVSTGTGQGAEEGMFYVRTSEIV